ncbi:hypothetical protein [Mycoplasma parvum]|uniref:Uncharacterized protein n=1 Tax=Mycoplasma parvum str. Indiana TaxID=1403316 RepID=U5NCH1_9MOLU|nr:hypothetical protein [Mycoplasma parvum]AGX89281.1 hypothetical protein PRV_02775 [Mycoplasma parvum str. Indiana]
MIISNKLLEFLLPEIKNVDQRDIWNALIKIQLEIKDIILETSNDKELSIKYIYRVKPVCSIFDYPSFWVLSQELALVLDIKKKPSSQEIKSFLFDEEMISYLLRLNNRKVSSNHSENVWQFLQLVFGDPKKDETIFKLGIWSFFKDKEIEWGKCPFQNEVIEFLKISDEKELFLGEKARSQVILSELLPIFKELKEDWENEVVDRLIPFNFSFEKLNFSAEQWEIHWPYWYKQENLPSFNEILFRLLYFSSAIRTIEEKNYEKLSEGQVELKSPFLFFLKLKNNLLKKGFLECNTTKFDISEINKLADVVLEHNPQVTLRDDITNSLLKQVLLRNLNQGSKIYPIFELAYCPWKETWELALLSTVLLLEGDKRYITERKIFFYSEKQLYEIVKELFNNEVEIKKLEKFIRIEHSGATEFAHINKNNEKIGVIRVHRLEAFEIRHMEVISICINLKSFY